MTAQAAEPVTSPAGSAAAADEFHPITVALAQDYTEITCVSCGMLEHAGGVTHGADHAIATGHTVTETHVRVTMITGGP